MEIIENAKEYVLEGTFFHFKAVKFGKIRVLPVTRPTLVQTWTDKGLLEQEVVVNDGYIAVKASESGYPMFDDNGLLNRWPISAEKLHSKYILAEDGNPELYQMYGAVFAPKPEPQEFVRLMKEVKIKTDYGYEVLPYGSFLNVTDLDNIYGINPRDFSDTYRIIK